MFFPIKPSMDRQLEPRTGQAARPEFPAVSLAWDRA